MEDPGNENAKVKKLMILKFHQLHTGSMGETSGVLVDLVMIPDVRLLKGTPRPSRVHPRSRPGMFKED